MRDGEGDGRGRRQRGEHPGRPLAALAPRRDLRRHAGLRALGDPLQLVGHVARALPAVLGILRQARPHDPVERGRRHRLDARDRRRLLLHDRRDERGLARAGERLAPGDHLVEHGAERENVRARVGLLALELFRRHVLEGPEDRSGLREVRGAGDGRQRRQARLLRHGGHRLGESEVEQLHARLREHHVAGLQVPVHDPLPVRLVERVGDLDPEAQRLVERERALAQAVAERFALEELHDEVLGLALASHVVQRADVRMRQLGNRLGLALEALAGLGRRGQVRRQDLDGDGPLEPRVLSPVDFPHAARADRRQDFVRTELRSRG